jgi:hypothetical protein
MGVVESTKGQLRKELTKTGGRDLGVRISSAVAIVGLQSRKLGSPGPALSGATVRLMRS